MLKFEDIVLHKKYNILVFVACDCITSVSYRKWLNINHDASFSDSATTFGLLNITYQYMVYKRW